MTNEVREYYEVDPGEYEAFMHNIKYQAPKSFFEFVQDHLTQTKRVLDVGAGTGLSSRFFISEGKEVYGIDFSERLLAHAAKNHAFKETRVADIFDGIPYSNNFFGAAISVGALHTYPNITSILEEMERVTKPQGYICFTTGGRTVTFPDGTCFYQHTEDDLAMGLRNSELVRCGNIFAHQIIMENSREDFHYDIYVFQKKIEEMDI